MYYSRPVILDRPLWNNTFVYDERKQLFGKAEIVVPQLIAWTIDDVKVGSHIVFAEEIDGEVREFRGLRDLVCMKVTSCKLQDESHSGDTKIAASSRLDGTPRNDEVVVYVMDNHNHALYCWYKEYLVWNIERWLPVIHIDQHSDMKDPVGWIDMARESDLEYIAQYTNEMCTIADFIQPALRSWLIGSCQQVRTENGLLELSFPVIPTVVEGSHRLMRFLDFASLHSKWHNNRYILDIDIDFWAPEMGIEEFDRTIQKVRQLIAGASMVTIATSPCFIEQERAVEIVKLLVQSIK